MNNDPLLVGVDSVFPNQNSSSAPTVWEEDLVEAAQQGIPAGSGPMLTLTKRSTNDQFLPGGAVNPAREPAPQCIIVDNIQTTAGASQRISASVIAAGLVGGQFVGGRPGVAGMGVVGVGGPGDGVRGLSRGDGPTGHGVFGATDSTSSTDAGVCGQAATRARAVLGRHTGFPPGSGALNLVTQAVRGEGGTLGVCGEGRTVNPDGTPAASSWGVFGKGVTAGVQGGDGRTGGIGVIGVSGPNFVSGGLTFTPWAGRFDGPVRVRSVAGAVGDLSVDGSLFVSGPTKASVLSHPDGSQRVMHTVEAPERWFEDIGRDRLRQGVARVEIDPDFAAVTGIGDDYHVFLTAEGPSEGLFVGERTPTGFEVREQGRGTSDISFSYRVMTRRANDGTGRLEVFELPASEAQGRSGQSAQSADSPAMPPEDDLPQVAPGPPADWPNSVPWPPEVLR
jgi:hypothetical protein